jgi:hypothetical protein
MDLDLEVAAEIRAEARADAAFDGAAEEAYELYCEAQDAEGPALSFFAWQATWARIDARTAAVEAESDEIPF